MTDNEKKRIYLVRWDEPSEEYVAKCDDYPSVSCLAGSAVDALADLIETLAEIDADIDSST